MPFIDHVGTPIYYERHGSGPAVVLLHGPGGHHAAWWQQVSALKDRFTVLTVDLRGFGSSSGAGDLTDARLHPGDVIAALEAAEVRDAVLVGQSIGATAALQAALRRPDLVAGVILAHSLGGLDDPELAALSQADQTAAQQLPVLDRLLSRDFQTREPALTFLFRQMGTLNAVKMPQLRHVGAAAPTVAQVTAAGVRVAFLTAEYDPLLTPATVRRAHARLPGSLLTVVPDAPHAMYWERPDLFTAAVASLAGRLTTHPQGVTP